MFAFTSMGGKIDKSVNQSRGPYCFKLGGQNYHLMGTEDRIRESEDLKVQIMLIGERSKDGRQYNLPTASEVVLSLGMLMAHMRNAILLYNSKGVCCIA